MNMHLNKNNFEFVQFLQEPFPFYKFFFSLEILWDELMSDSSYIGHLLSSMVNRLAEVFPMVAAWRTNSILILCIIILCVKLDFSFLRLLQSCRISLYVYTEYNYYFAPP